jgi:hypothetical protein
MLAPDVNTSRCVSSWRIAPSRKRFSKLLFVFIASIGTYVSRPCLGGSSPWFLAIRLLVAEKNRGDLHHVLSMERHKNEAIPADAFAVPLLPSSPLQGLDIPLEGVLPHPINRSADGDLVISGKRSQLFRRLRGKSNRPCGRHRIKDQAASSRHPRPCVRPF